MYPDTPNFEPSRLECPRCGATNSNRSEDRVVQGNTRFELTEDGDFRVIFEVACPCGFRDDLMLAGNRPADADDLASELAVEADPDPEGSIVDDAVDAGGE